MNFDWQGMLDYVVHTEDQYAIAKADHTPYPVPEADQSPMSFYEPAFYDAVIVPQPCTTDGSSIPVYSSEESCDAISTTTLLTDSTSLESLQQEYYTDPEYSTYQNVQIPFTSVPTYLVEQYLDESQPYVLPQQQVVPQESEPLAPTTVAFPIKIEVMGYVGEEVTKATPSSPKKKGAKKVKKNLKKFTSAWNCEPCGRSFKSKGGLLQHNKQIHSGPTPHGCDICGKRYRDFDTMQQHRQRHLMKDKPFKCDECPRQFIRLSDLLRHVNLHHGESRHRCGFCGKAFDRADHLRDHELSHENGTVKKRRAPKLNQTIS